MQKSTLFQVYNASAGSGKTFTLVKEYLKILLSSNNSFKFQQILAVTFTNKAAGEMKERVIKNLNNFSKEDKNDMLAVICEEANLTEEIVFSRSKIILNAILQNYSAFSITTIDSFTHKLIRTFAHDLHLPLNFEVEMDAESLLNEAVDVVISKIGDQKELTDLLVSYSLQKLDDDKAWDISNELKSFSKIVLNENHASHLKLLNDISIDDFKNLKEKLLKENKIIETGFEQIGSEGIALIRNNGLEFNEFSYSGELPKHFVKLKEFRHQKPDSLKFDGRLNKTIEEGKNLYAAKTSDSSKQAIESIAFELKEFYYKSKKLHTEVFGKYVLNSIIVESLIPLAVLSYINSALEEIKSENNILLNAEFNQLINNTIKNEPAPFIYERIGEKYRYYFIDEMQDTSELQWRNLIPLIDNVVSSENEIGEKGKLLLVGDAKQSIYRWRGGKAEQFIALSSPEKKKENNPFYIEKNLCNLDTNYRSFSEIIAFNNTFFSHVSKFLKNDSFNNLFYNGSKQLVNKNIGGFVQLSFVEKQKDAEENALIYPKKVFDIIDNLDTEYQKNEVCVLVRTRKQGVAVADYLTENGIEIISSETLLLGNNINVSFIINLLYVLQNPNNKEYKIKLLYFLCDYLNVQSSKHSFFNELVHLNNEQFFDELRSFNIFFNYNEFIQNPFYESIEYIIRSFNLVLESDSNVQFFLDIVFEFQQKQHVSLIAFLEFWELKKDKLSIVAPEAKNAIRIMTIHKAKGLEFPVVIFPYDINIYNQIKPKVWYNYEQSSPLKSILINYSSKLNHIGKQGKRLFDERQEELELDNFNILYVALTRPVEQLYIISEKKISSKNEENLNHTSGLFINYLKELKLWESEKNEYCFGDPLRIGKNEEVENKSITQKSFISNSWKNHNISIVTSSSLLWETEQGKSIVYGNLIHEILSRIKEKSDIEDALHHYLYKGVVNSVEQKKIASILHKIVSHPKLVGYFEPNKEVYNEQEIVTVDREIVIPDRIVVEKGIATIIDYKTGSTNKKHESQLQNYANALNKIGYTIGKKILVYINDEIIVQEV